MLPLKNRLKKSTDITKVFAGGKSAQNGFLFLKFYPNNSQHSRVAFSIGLKYSKSAVERNRVKRLLRTATHQLLQEMEPGFDIVVNVKKTDPQNITPETTMRYLKKALLFAKILKQ